MGSIVATAGVAGLTGCIGGGDGASKGTPDTTSPEGVYIPSHMDMMEMIGMQKAGRLMVSLSYTSPHEFFVVTGSRTNKTEIQDGDTMHLMAMVHDMKTGLIAPQVEPTITISKDGEELTSNQPWPMLSQSMGYHFGDNVTVSGKAAYQFDVTVNAAQSVLSDDLADVFTKETFTFESKFDPASASHLGIKKTGDKAGTAGALPPMNMDKMGIPQQPEYGEMPLQLTEPQYTDDIAVAVAAHDDPAGLGFMGVEATVTRDGDEVFAGELTSAVNGELGHYYGAGTPPLESGDTVELKFVTPPQGARHIGYETAFLELDALTFTL